MTEQTYSRYALYLMSPVLSAFNFYKLNQVTYPKELSQSEFV